MGCTERSSKGRSRVIQIGVFAQIGDARGDLDGPLQGFPAMENPPSAADERALLIDLKRGVHAENGFPVLNALDTARGKTLPIAYSIDMEYNGLIHPPWSQKVRMK